MLEIPFNVRIICALNFTQGLLAMSLKELRDRKETPEDMERVARGFSERLKSYNERFERREDKLAPTEKFYLKSYNM